MIAVVDYGMGNVRSVLNAFQAIGCDAIVSRDPLDLEKADHLVLPGVGAFADGMRCLAERGLADPLRRQVLENGTPLLGICLGMQLLALDSTEQGPHEGLGWVSGHVDRLAPQDPRLKVPHVGWNDVRLDTSSPLFVGLAGQETLYFVHSFYLTCDKPESVTATCDYGQVFTAAIQDGPVFATQFHPEKSQEAGLEILLNFSKVSRGAVGASC